MAKHGASRRWLPGERAQQEKTVKRILRVDHAGEFGARRIYAGQLAVLGDAPQAAAIRAMARQEDEHFAAFEQAMKRSTARPTALLPIWNFLGYALGAVTAALGAKAAMACTVAVEETIVDHYSRQLEELGSSDPVLRKLILDCRDDEDEHRRTGLAHGAKDAPAYPLLRATVRGAARAAIVLSERV